MNFGVKLSNQIVTILTEIIKSNKANNGFIKEKENEVRLRLKSGKFSSFEGCFVVPLC